MYGLILGTDIRLPLFLSLSLETTKQVKESTGQSVKLSAMNIEIHDPDLRARLQRQIETTGSGSVEETLQRLLETQEEQDRWVAQNREAIDEKIKRGLDQLDQGRGIPDTQLDSYMAKLKAKK
jgi:post-segregation antitoxin (ccd killing protein)